MITPLMDLINSINFVLHFYKGCEFQTASKNKNKRCRCSKGKGSLDMSKEIWNE